MKIGKINQTITSTVRLAIIARIVDIAISSTAPMNKMDPVERQKVVFEQIMDSIDEKRGE